MRDFEQEYDGPFDYELDALDDSLHPYHVSRGYDQVISDDFPFADDRVSIKTLLDNCIHPVLTDDSTSGFPNILRLIGLCLLLRFTAGLNFLPAFVVPLTSLMLGVYALFLFFGAALLYVLLPVFACYALLWLTLKRYQSNGGRQNSDVARDKESFCGPVVFCLCISYILILELFELDAKRFTQIRGSLMIVTMKLISISFDFDAGISGGNISSSSSVPLLKFLSYTLCVSSVIFGPWLSYSEHLRIISRKDLLANWRALLDGLFSLGAAVFCMLYCSCVVDWLFLSTHPTWIKAYGGAQTFRFSHYFVCLLAEATLLISGSHRVVDATVVGKEPRSSGVVQPLHIELPRSLVEVVIRWNVPMHLFLRIYVFRTSREKFGAWCAILLTYFTSAILHGLNFSLAAVLLSLGFYTYTEHILREKLANLFNACVRARACNSDCSHAYKKWHPCVLFANCCFGALAVFHLAYLGCIFHGSMEEAEQGFSMSHALAKWSSLNFASHLVGLACFVLAKLI